MVRTLLGCLVAYFEVLQVGARKNIKEHKRKGGRKRKGRREKEGERKKREIARVLVFVECRNGVASWCWKEREERKGEVRKGRESEGRKGEGM